MTPAALTWYPDRWELSFVLSVDGVSHRVTYTYRKDETLTPFAVDLHRLNLSLHAVHLGPPVPESVS